MPHEAMSLLANFDELIGLAQDKAPRAWSVEPASFPPPQGPVTRSPTSARLSASPVAAAPSNARSAVDTEDTCSVASAASSGVSSISSWACAWRPPPAVAHLPAVLSPLAFKRFNFAALGLGCGEPSDSDDAFSFESTARASAAAAPARSGMPSSGEATNRSDVSGGGVSRGGREGADGAPAAIRRCSPLGLGAAASAHSPRPLPSASVQAPAQSAARAVASPAVQRLEAHHSALPGAVLAAGQAVASPAVYPPAAAVHPPSSPLRAAASPAAAPPTVGSLKRKREAVGLAETVRISRGGSSTTRESAGGPVRPMLPAARGGCQPHPVALPLEPPVEPPVEPPATAALCVPPTLPLSMDQEGAHLALRNTARRREKRRAKRREKRDEAVEIVRGPECGSREEVVGAAHPGQPHSAADGEGSGSFAIPLPRPRAKGNTVSACA